MLDRRPTLVAGAGLVVGLTSLSHPLNLLALPALLYVLQRSAMRWTLPGFVAVGLSFSPTPLSSVPDRQFVRGGGIVVGLPRTGPEGTQVDLAVQDRVWRVRAPECPEIALGDRVEVEGVGLPLREGSERYLLLHGVTGRLQARKLSFVSPGPPVWRWSDRWRRSFGAFCRLGLPPQAAALTQALCFDLNGELDPKTTDRLRETGTIHIVSASGLHVFLLAYSLMFGLSHLPVPRWFQILALAGVLVLYAGATGLNPPVVRAALMSLVGLSAYIVRRERDALSALGLAALIYLLWQPRQIYDPGFQLSFLTVGAMALFLQPRDRPRHLLWENCEDVARASWVAWIASTPIVAYHFGTVSLSALPANLLIALPVSAAVVSALGAQALSWLAPPLGVGVLTLVTGPMAGWVLWVVERLGGLGWSCAGVPAFSAYWLPLVYGLLLLTWRQRIAHPN